ncbi:hypothetical protein B566_EDAN010964 [Ephemera danica]|nr:hypothetical protein B566_EDAN010964 [Ephemera danica]
MPQTNNTSNSIVTTPSVVPDTGSRFSPVVRTPPPPTSLLGSLVTAHTGPMPVPRTSPSSVTNNGSISHQIHARPTSSLLQSSSASAGLLAAANTPLMSPAEASAPASNKILGRNVNGTLVMTSAPSNEAELQLYRVMQRASLLAYYDTLLEMGGDDVQQLCEAGEEEFLEIMALVGMASKPLHVRRLQKALQEWVSNPGEFVVLPISFFLS